MYRYQQAAATILLIFAAFIIWQAVRLQYYTPLGPGAGFFAVWLGALLGLLALVQLVQVTRSSRSQESEPAPSVDGVETDGGAEQGLPGWHGLVRIGATIGALILTALLLPLLGFQVTVFLLLIFLLLGLERVRPVTTVVIALAFSVGLFQILTRYLDVELPLASLSWLKSLGL